MDTVLTKTIRKRKRKTRINVDRLIGWLKWLGLIAVILYGKGDYDKTRDQLSLLQTALEIAMLKAEPAPAAGSTETIIYREVAPGVRIPVVDTEQGTEQADTEADTEEDVTAESGTNEPAELPVKPLRTPGAVNLAGKETRWALLFPAPFECPPCELARLDFAARQAAGQQVAVIEPDGGAVYQQWLELVGPIDRYPLIVVGEQRPGAAFDVSEKIHGFDEAVAAKVTNFFMEKDK